MNDREFINMIIDSYLSYTIDPHMATINNTVANRLRDIADKLDKYKEYQELEANVGLSLKTLIEICDTTQPIKIDEEHVGLEVNREKWKNVKCCIPDSFNSSSIMCDVWYGENFTGGVDKLMIPIKEFGKTWWLAEKKK